MSGRNKRLRPGQTYGSGRGGIDLGAILSGIYGGIEANPDFGQAQTSADPNLIGPMPAKKGADNFYKPRSIFDRADAARANAEFKAENYNADRDIDRDIGKEQRMVPIKNALAEYANKLAQEQSRFTNNSALLTRRNMLDTDANRASYDRTNTPLAQDAAAQSDLADAEKSKYEAIKSNIGYQGELGSANNTLRGILANALANRMRAEGSVDLVPDELTNKKVMLREQPAWMASQAQQGKIHSVSPGQSLVDSDIGKVLYSAPTQTETMLKSLGTKTTPNVPLSTPQMPTPPQTTDSQIAGNVVKIGGKLYRVIGE